MKYKIFVYNISLLNLQFTHFPRTTNFGVRFSTVCVQIIGCVKCFIAIQKINKACTI